MAAPLRFSVVVTVFNEEASIEPLCDSIYHQAYDRHTYELIIVDAGSTDATVQKIKAWIKTHKGLRTLLLRRPQVNRSVGRNLGIKQAHAPFIAVTDAGCLVSNGWLKAIDAAYKSHPNREVVAGSYRYPHDGSLSQLFGLYLGIPFSEDKPYLPSSRSIAFTISAFEKVGGYPEHLNTCEDLVLAQKLAALGPMHLVPEAWVWWQPPPTLAAFLGAVSGYAEGDVLAAYTPHLRKIGGVYGRWMVLLGFPFLIPVYLFLAVMKKAASGLPAGLWAWVPITQLVSDLGVVMGSVRGVLGRYFKTEAEQ